MPIHDVVVVGAGWAGLSAAARLSEEGLDVVVLEKARGPGGRSATRRQDGFSFDHGAQYFTARHAAFQAKANAWQQAGLVAPWEPRIQTFGQRPPGLNQTPQQRLVAVPGMNAVLSHLAADLDCRFGQRITAMSHKRHWTLEIEQAEPVQAKSVLLTAPPAQTIRLLGQDHPLAEQLAAVSLRPTWALMVGFDQPLGCDFDAAFDNQGPLAWLACNSSKPGRKRHGWVAHASTAWSEANLEISAEAAAEQLFAAFAVRVTQANQVPASVCIAHRWRYAQSPEPLDRQSLVHPPQSLAVAGDWCAGNRVEGAWLSGQSAAEGLRSF